MDYTQLLGFPIEVVLVAIICYTIVQVVTLWVNKNKTHIDTPKKEESNPPKPKG